MNKPAGVVTTRSDELGRKTVYDLLGEQGKWIFPVGRLDKETTGLLLLTNDHRLGEQLTNPASRIPKCYRVELDKTLTEGERNEIEGGLLVDDEQLLPATVTPVGDKLQSTQIDVTIYEGKNRQIRRMFESFGHTVLSLERISIGELHLGNLEIGKVRELTIAEMKSLTVSSDTSQDREANEKLKRDKEKLIIKEKK